MIKYKEIEFLENGDRLTIDIVEAVFSRLPKDYTKFLIDVNGGKPPISAFYTKEKKYYSNVNYFWGITERPYMNLINGLFKDYLIPSNTMAIADDGKESLILLAVKMSDFGKIYFWDHNYEASGNEVPTYDNLTLIADSFDELLYPITVMYLHML